MMRKMTGGELFEHLKTLNSEELMVQFIEGMKKAELVLNELPHDAEHSAPIVFWFIAGEVARRFAELNNIVVKAEELVDTVVAAVQSAQTPPDQRH